MSFSLQIYILMGALGVALISQIGHAAYRRGMALIRAKAYGWVNEENVLLNHNELRC